LYCLPHAGGGASSFTSWARELPDFIEVCAAQLPGRETRIAEPTMTDIHAMSRVLAHEIACAGDLPFAIFGHSMGAAIGYEIAQELLRAGGPAPMRIFASGASAPHLPITGPRLAELPTDELIQGLIDAGGIPAGLFDKHEYLQLIAPALRADLAIAENHQSELGPVLPYPISALTGAEDHHVPMTDVKEWEKHTSAGFTVRVFRGGHFFHREQAQAVLAAVADDISLDIALRLS
jgi:medium-chain acyl-[acyl-carrier-protein] hydrolase